MAALIVVQQGIKVKAIYCPSLDADVDLDKKWPQLLADSIAIHAAVNRQVTNADEAREENYGHGFWSLALD